MSTQWDDDERSITWHPCCGRATLDAASVEPYSNVAREIARSSYQPLVPPDEEDFQEGYADDDDDGGSWDCAECEDVEGVREDDADLLQCGDTRVVGEMNATIDEGTRKGFAYF